MDIERKGRIWAEINLDNLIHNFKAASAHCKGARPAAVLKANAYGHGAVQCARALIDHAGCDFIAVAAPEEAFQLRRAGIECDILLLGIAPQCYVAELSQSNIICACPSVEMGRMFSENATCPLRIHAVLDSGMSRLGFECLKGVEQAGEGVIALSSMKNLVLEGAFTHFCVSDTDTEDKYTLMQLDLFKKTVEYVKSRGVPLSLVHCANSGAITRFAEIASMDIIRQGIMLYGADSDPCMHGIIDIKPVMSVRCRIMQVKEIEAGVTVGYGRTWRAERKTEVATIGIGYADGLLRSSSNKIEMLVGGKRAKQIGRICMDIAMLDVTGLSAKEGDVVTFFGQDAEQSISVVEQAKTVPTISHEMLCAISPRVPRIYYMGGKAVERVELL